MINRSLIEFNQTGTERSSLAGSKSSNFGRQALKQEKYENDYENIARKKKKRAKKNTSKSETRTRALVRIKANRLLANRPCRDQSHATITRGRCISTST